MKKHEIIEINIDKIIALCHILDNYEDFSYKLSDFLDFYNAKLTLIAERINKLVLYVNNEKERCSRVIKDFYINNKEVIDTIKMYIPLDSYIRNTITPKENYAMDRMYEYLLKNKDNLEQILVNLYKIKELGFRQISFDENIDFSKTVERYYRNHFVYYDNEIVYFDNLEYIPEYRNDYISYKTSNSPFKIECILYLNKFRGMQPKRITLNDLTFDDKRLPEAIEEEIICKKFNELFKQNEDTFNKIRDSVNLNVSIDDLAKKIEQLEETISNLSDVKRKEDLLKALYKGLYCLREQFNMIKELGVEYNKNIAISDEFITEELLENEKNAYVKRREI